MHALNTSGILELLKLRGPFFPDKVIATLNPTREQAMRCFFMRHGRIADVELLPGLTDAQAVEKSRE
jgi:hypothetical protein